MNKQLFFVEVGVLLTKDHDEYNYYCLQDFYTDMYYAFYDENRIAFTNKDTALDYLKQYVKNGVVNTYGILHSYVCNITDEQLQEIEDFGSCEYIDNPTKETTLHFEYKDDLTNSIIIVKDTD